FEKIGVCSRAWIDPGCRTARCSVVRSGRTRVTDTVDCAAVCVPARAGEPFDDWLQPAWTGSHKTATTPVRQRGPLSKRGTCMRNLTIVNDHDDEPEIRHSSLALDSSFAIRHSRFYLPISTCAGAIKKAAVRIVGIKRHGNGTAATLHDGKHGR